MSLKITRRDDRYSVVYERPEGRIACEISVARHGGVADRRTQHEKYTEARNKLRRLLEELLSSISDIGDEKD